MKRDWRIYAAAGVVLAIIGGTFALLAPSGHKPPSLPVVASSVAPKVTPSASPTTAAYPRTVPSQVIIPSIGVNAPVMSLGLCPTSRTDEDCSGVQSGGLATPPLSDGNLTGWWSGGFAPGQNGEAVIAGHIDNPNPAVFWNLGKLVAGESIEIEPGNLSFTVAGKQEVSKSDETFWTSFWQGTAVQGAPVLILITCGGTFDPTSGHYVNDVVVTATENVGH